MMRLADRRLLVIETSTSHGSLALFHGRDCLDSWAFVASRGLNSRIYEPLGEMLRSLPSPGRELLTDVLVGVGPGSYTGVRISIAVGAALAVSGKARLHGLISLAGMPGAGESFLVTGDARRNTFYWATLSRGKVDGDIEVLPRAAWETRLCEVQASSRLPILTTDAMPPAPGVTTVFPTAEALGRRFLQDPPSLHAVDVPVEPIYLAGPYITQPRKPGKTVGRPDQGGDALTNRA